MGHIRIKNIFLLYVVISLLNISSIEACTMFRLTIGGKTLIGNNEDFHLPYSRFWVEPSGEDRYVNMIFEFIHRRQ